MVREDLDTTRAVPASAQRGRLLERGDILLEKSGNVGFPALFEGATRAISSNFLVRLRSREGVDSRFAWYLLQALWARGDGRRFANETTLANLDLRRFLATWVEVPPTAAQRAIAKVLDVETRHLDALSELKGRQRQLVAERHQALTNALIVGAEDTGRRTPLMYLVDPARPPMYGILMPGPSVSEGISVIDAGDVEAERLHPDNLRRTTPEVEQPYARARLEAADLVMSIRGSFGAVAEVPPSLAGANVSRDVARIAPATGVSTRWLYHALRSQFVFTQLNEGAMGSAVRGINIRNLKRVQVPVPVGDAQDDLARRLDDALDTTRTLTTQLDHQLRSLHERRRRLVLDQTVLGAKHVAQRSAA